LPQLYSTEARINPKIKIKTAILLVLNDLRYKDMNIFPNIQEKNKKLASEVK